MSYFESLEFSDLVAARHCRSVELHGSLGISQGALSARLMEISSRYQGASPSEKVIVPFVSQLHIEDIVLVMACALHTEAAWQVFRTLYRKYVCELCYYLIRNTTEAEDFADGIWGELYMPDRSGRSRIASFDGRSSLSTWMRVIVSNRIVNHRRRRSATDRTLEDIPEPIDSSALKYVEGSWRSRRYELMIMQCLRLALRELNRHDRMILLLRYDQGLRLGQVAKMCSIHQSTVTRQLERVSAQLREKVVALLKSDHRLDAAGVEECISIALESFSATIPILSFVKGIDLDRPQQMPASLTKSAYLDESRENTNPKLLAFPK